MIRHEIIIKEEVRQHRVNVIKLGSPGVGPGKFKGEFGSPEHKEYIFSRASKKCHFGLGDVVRYKGVKVQIVDIYTHISEPIAWDKLKPCFIEVMTDDNVLFLVHPGDIKKPRGGK